MPLPFRTGLVAATAAAALALTASAAYASGPFQAVNGHQDTWVQDGSPSGTYDNGYRMSQSDIQDALKQCGSRSVSCAATQVGSPTYVTKWFDVDNTDMNAGPIENCAPTANPITQTLSGSHTFTWGWNVGANVDVTLIKDVLKVGASAQYSESNATATTGSIGITVNSQQKGMLKVGYDMERRVSNVSIQGGKFGGAQISGLRTEIPLKDTNRVGTDIVPCGGSLLNGR